MKLKNVVVGTRIQAKRDVTGLSGEHIPRGLEVTVGMVQDDSYPVRIDHADIEDGYAWVDPTDFRKVKEVVIGGTTNVEVCTVQNTEVGDFITSTVKGDGYRVAQQPLEVGKQYKVVEIIPDGTSISGFTVKIDVPHTHWSADSCRGGYYAHIGEFTRPVVEPTEHVYSVGDKVLVGVVGAGYAYVDPDLKNKVCTVTVVQDDGCLRIAYPKITTTNGYLTYPCFVSPYVNPAEPTYKVGDKVLVGSEGAGYGYIKSSLAGQICTISQMGHLPHRPECVELVHPIHCPRGYASLPEYISPYVEPEPVVQEKLSPTYIQVGDYILSSGHDPELEVGTLYEVVEVTPRLIGIDLHTSSNEAWQECYCLTSLDYSKVLREVQPDADTPT